MKNRTFLSLLVLIIMVQKVDAQTYINENFNTGIPITWGVSAPTCYDLTDTIKWKPTTNGFRGQGLPSFSLDGTEFVVVDSDGPGLYCLCNEYLTTPVFDATSSTVLTLEFDQYYRHYNGDYGYVEVFNGSTWATVATFSTSSGGWLTPNHQTIDLTSFINANMQVRFHYNANWDYYWSLDNVLIYGGSNPLVVSASAVSDTICYGSCTDITASGANTYTWMPGNLSGTTVNVCPTSTTIYTVVGTIGGSTAATTVTVTVHQLPLVTLSTFIDTCISVTPFGLIGGSPSGGIYSGTGVVGNNFNPSNAGAGTFQITYSYTDLNGCIGSATQNVTVNPMPLITAIATQDTICLGSCTNLTASGGDVYNWAPLGLSGSTINVCPTTSTNYTVTGIDMFGCSNMNTVFVFVDPCLGVSDNNNNTSVTIFPNPSNGKIQILSKKLEVKSIELYNLQGKLVEAEHFCIPQSKAEIDVSTLTKGIYMLKLQGENRIINRKLVIQ